MRRLATVSMRCLAVSLAASVLVGCQGFNLPITGAGARYGQLAFGPAGQNTVALLGSQGKGTTEQAAAPMAAPTAGRADMAVGAPAMGMVAPYYYGGYWGNEYELISTTEAKTGGYQGTYQQALDSVVKPMVNDWATDAVLRSVSGITDGAGINPKASPMPSPPMPQIDPSASVSPDEARKLAEAGKMASMPAMMPYYQPPAGWRFEYASRAKRESLHFFVTAESTLVVKQAYRERTQDLTGARLNSAEVIAIVTKAIQNKSIQANDPLMPQGGSGGGSVGVGVAYPMPAIATAPGTAVIYGASTDKAVAPVALVNMTTPGGTSAPGYNPDKDGPPPTPTSPQTRPAMPAEEELTTLPANPRWDLSLQLEPLPNQDRPDGTNPTPAKTRLIWNVTVIGTITTEPGAGYNPGWARVDATTGTLLNLSRPRKHTFGYTDPPMPEPMPAVSAVSAGPAPSLAAK
jgi:hypothetical protein